MMELAVTHRNPIAFFFDFAKKYLSVIWLPGKPLFLGFMLLSLAGLSACRHEDPPDHPTVLRVGLLPDEAAEVIFARHIPLFAYLEQETGIRFDLIVPDSYSGLMNMFKYGKVDLAYFGGLSFITTHRSSNAVPLVSRDSDTQFTSLFITHANNDLKTIRDFKGMPLTFGSRRSTSGHLMPRYFLSRQDIIPEEFFSAVDYTASHDKAIQAVLEQKFDLGAINPMIYQRMVADGRIAKGDIRIVWETPPYINYVWAVQPAMNAATRERLATAFLKLNPAIAEHRAILSNLDAQHFLRADIVDFAALEFVADSLQLLK